jgi:hypothetical protein
VKPEPCFGFECDVFDVLVVWYKRKIKFINSVVTTTTTTTTIMIIIIIIIIIINAVVCVIQTSHV